MAIDEKLISRINELAKKQKKQGLSEEEKKEQIELRELYIKKFRGNMKSVLNKVEVVDKMTLEKTYYTLENIKSKLSDVEAVKKINDLEDFVEILYDYKAIEKKDILDLLN